MRHTIAEVAGLLGVDKDLARGLVKFAEGIGVAENMGARRPASGIGRSEVIYQFRDGFEKDVADFLARAKLSD